MSTVAITGSSGYFGERLIHRLQDHPGIDRLVGVDVRDPHPDPSEKVTHYRLDIRNSLLPQLLAALGVDTIIHLAFSVKPIHDRRVMHEINLVGALNLLRAARLAKVRRIILLSSTTVYGFHRDNPYYMTEARRPRPNREMQYAVDKVEVETLVQHYAQKNSACRTVILRPCSMTGSRVQNYLSDYLSNPIVPVIVGYDPLFQFVHVDDVIDATICALDRRDATGIFNIVGDGAIPLRNVVKLSGGIPLPVPTPIAGPVNDLLWYLKLARTSSGSLSQYRFSCLASNQRLKNELGITPSCSSEEALKREIDYQRVRRIDGEEPPRDRAPLSDALREYYRDRERAEEERILRVIHPRHSQGAPALD